jgi:phosphoglucosamine mutase
MIYFGTDGIRGEVGTALPYDRAFQLGYAIKHVYKDKKVIIAYDTRASYLDFTYALLQGLYDVDVEVLGMYPTPVLAYVSKEKNAIGIMITASHNPYTDNGLKVFEEGLKLSTPILEKLERFMQNAPIYKHQVIAFQESQDINAYLSFLKSLNFKDDISQYALFDCANGATSFLVPKLFHGIYMHHHPNGKNINLNCGSTFIENYQHEAHVHDVIITYDGDGDRMVAIIGDHIVYGDTLLYLFAKADAFIGIKNPVALSIMTNPGILKALKNMGINVYETQVGDSYIIDTIQKKHAIRGAEASGHVITEHVTIGDGILATYKLLDLMSTFGIKEVKTWLDKLVLYPMITKSINISKDVLKHPKVKDAIDAIKKDIEVQGKVIVRASGTEDLVRITVSLASKTEVHHHIQKIETLLRSHI